MKPKRPDHQLRRGTGVLVVKELDKEVLSKGAWTTILYRYQDLDRATGEFGPDKYSSAATRSRKASSSPNPINISSAAQAEKIIETLSRWLNKK